MAASRDRLCRVRCGSGFINPADDPRSSSQRYLAPAPQGIDAYFGWAEADGSEPTRMPGGQSRWSAGKDLSWEPLRIERVCEVKYDHLQGDRFRHAAVFLRWRPDKPPSDCRYDQLEVTKAYELEKIFGLSASTVRATKQELREERD